MSNQARQETAGTAGRFTANEIRSLVERDKGKKTHETRAKSPTFKGIKFPELAAKGTRPAVATSGGTPKEHPSVTQARLRLNIITNR